MNYSQLLESIEFWQEIESTPSVVVCFKQVKFGGDTKYFGNGKGQMRDSGFGNMNKCEINFHKHLLNISTRMSKEVALLFLLCEVGG